MGWTEIVGAVLQLILLWVRRWFTYDDAKNEEIKKLDRELKDAIKANDVSAINITVQRIKRL